ncbi:MAG: sigma 54-interacting transcriptional regulator [Polyangiaceae bacterium]|nr:sigma 54-interacting transcriptional regulator [Polyangiaceae bacterium]
MKLTTPPARTWTIDACTSGGTRRVGLSEGESIVVGSSPRNDITVEAPGVAPRHCRIGVEDGALVVRDLGALGVYGGGGAWVQEARFGDDGTFAIPDTLFVCAPFLVDAPDAGDERPLDGVVGDSAPMRRLARQVRRYAPLRASVLIRGETGSGKELVAAALHAESARADRPFVPLNMGALPPELADSELFGHERGAFTGAVAQRRGAFEAAGAGTLFLDEIGELPLSCQAKLLRTLECGEVRPLGASGLRRAEARVVAATWQSLSARVAEGSFREDLYHRLAVLTVDVPPLRERRADLPALARLFLGALEPDVGPKQLHPSTLARLGQYAFPGNVRELKNLLLRAALAAEGRVIRPVHLQLGVESAPRRPATPHERTRQIVERHGGNVTRTARTLGVSRTTVRRWLARA